MFQAISEKKIGSIKDLVSQTNYSNLIIWKLSSYFKTIEFLTQAIWANNHWESSSYNFHGIGSRKLFVSYLKIWITPGFLKDGISSQNTWLT